MKKVRSALSGMELEGLNIEVGSVTYTGDTEPEKVAAAINDKTSFKAAAK